MQELIDRLAVLNARWTSSDIESEEYAAEVAHITGKLRFYVSLVEQGERAADCDHCQPPRR